jgi:hypothetical protein
LDTGDILRRHFTHGTFDQFGLIGMETSIFLFFADVFFLCWFSHFRDAAGVARVAEAAC